MRVSQQPAAAVRSVIMAGLPQKVSFPQTSAVIIAGAYFKCALINHVTVEVPLGRRACWEMFPFMSGGPPSRLAPPRHEADHVMAVVSSAATGWR